MTSKENKRDHFIRKAREARELAERMTDPWVKKSMEEIAEGYEHLAERATEDEGGETGRSSDL
jgi:hypothetical protein